MARVIIMSGIGTSEEMKYWQVSPGREKRGLWPEFKSNNIIAMGWDDLGDLRDYDTGNEIKTKQNILKALKKHYTYTTDPLNDVNSIYVFFKEIKPGHIVVAKKGYSKEIYGIGKVLKGYRFDSSREIFKHVISVN
jgi:5-methylcytosine-specific restriction protein B